MPDDSRIDDDAPRPPEARLASGAAPASPYPGFFEAATRALATARLPHVPAGPDGDGDDEFVRLREENARPRRDRELLLDAASWFGTVGRAGPGTRGGADAAG